MHVRVCFSPRSARGNKVQTCAGIMVRVHFHFESWVRGTRELPWSHLLPAARPGNVRPTILCSRPGYFHTGWVSLKKGSLLQARAGRSRFMLRQLRLEMSLSQCGLAHTYPASETPYHCPGAPLCYLLTLPRGRMTEVFMTLPLIQGTLSPLKRINIK